MPPPQTPALTVDIVIPAGDSARELVLIQRANEPFEGSWALPGGFVEVGESVEKAAVREVEEETGLKVRLVSLVGVYSQPGRDPRGHNVSVAYLAQRVEHDSGSLEAGTDASGASLVDPDSVSLAFDHRDIVRDALSRER